MEEDRISQLPDNILQHILSFIDTFEAVQTSILSKRWKNLWRSLPDIRFHFTLTAHGDAFRFSNRISNFLCHRDAAAPVRDFHLSFDKQYDSRGKEDSDGGLAMESVLYAINHGVQSLRLQEPDFYILRLPVALIASKTLQELELRCLRANVPGRLSLPNLKTLYLQGDVKFTGYEGMEPFAGLPKLEELSMRVRGEFDVPLLSSPNLKTLHLEGLFMFFNDDQRMEPFANLPELEKLILGSRNTAFQILKAPKLRVLEICKSMSPHYLPEISAEISAPLLTSFKYLGQEPLKCSKVNLPMLEEVYIDIPFWYNDVRNKCVRFHQNCVRLLRQFGNATIVSLTMYTLKALELNVGGLTHQTPPFPNMKCLKIIKGRYQINTTFHPRVMDYLTKKTLYSGSLKVEIPDGVTVAEPDSDDSDDSDEYHRYVVKCKNKFSVLADLI